MSYGQFIDHDLAETPVNNCSDGSMIECCEDIKCPNCDCKQLFLVTVIPWFTHLSWQPKNM